MAVRRAAFYDCGASSSDTYGYTQGLLLMNALYYRLGSRLCEVGEESETAVIQWQPEVDYSHGQERLILYLRPCENNWQGNAAAIADKVDKEGQVLPVICLQFRESTWHGHSENGSDIADSSITKILQWVVKQYSQ